MLKILKLVLASTEGFQGGLCLDQALQERHGSDFFLLSSMRVIGMAFLCERHCVPLRPCWPLVPPDSRALPPPRVLPGSHVRLFCCSFFCGVPPVALSAAPARPACAPCSSPCYPCLAAPRPLTRPSPLPFSVSQPTLPVRLPSLSEPRCHSCVPPACSTPAPLCRPYPFPCCLSHPSVPSVPVSHLILDAMCPVWGGGGGRCICGLDSGPARGLA